MKGEIIWQRYGYGFNWFNKRLQMGEVFNFSL